MKPEHARCAKLVPRHPKALETRGLELTPDRGGRSSAYRHDPRRSALLCPALSPPWRQCAFCPFDVLCSRLAMLFNQIPQQCTERLALLMFRQYPRDITRNRIRSSGADLPVDFRKLILGQTDGDFRPGHTSIIPPAGGGNKAQFGACGKSRAALTENALPLLLVLEAVLSADLQCCGLGADN
jgi:hypothetical protein